MPRWPSPSSSTNIWAIICRRSEAGASTGRWVSRPCGSGRRPAMIMRSSCMPRTRSRRAGGLRSACWGQGVHRRLCVSNIGGAQQIDYASLVDLKTGEVVWFNVVIAGSQVPGIVFGDLRTAGAAQMVDRLLRPYETGPGHSPGSGSDTGDALMCMRCLEITRRSMLVEERPRRRRFMRA